MCVTVDACGRSTSGFMNAHFRYSRARSRGGGSGGADNDSDGDEDEDEDGDMADDEDINEEAYSVEVWFAATLHSMTFQLQAQSVNSVRAGASLRPRMGCLGLHVPRQENSEPAVSRGCLSRHLCAQVLLRAHPRTAFCRLFQMEMS